MWEAALRDYVVIEIYRLMGMDWQSLCFGPCLLRMTNPVNIDHERLKNLTSEWFVTLKCDGHRLLLVVVSFSGRRYKVSLDRSCNFDIIENLVITEHDKHNGIEFALDCEKIEHNLICHDVLVFERVPVLFRDFCRRLKYIYKVVEYPFLPKSKKFFPIGNIDMVKDDTKSDGFIFIHCNFQFTPGQSSQLLKWKPMNRISIDLFVKQDRKVYAVSKGQYVQFSQPIREYELSLEECADQIIEFFFDGSAWFPALIRSDKNTANNLHVVIETVRSAQQPVTRDELVNKCKLLR